MPVLQLYSIRCSSTLEPSLRRPVIKKDHLYLPTIDGWRAIAILLVLCCHVSLPMNWFQRVHDYGKLGVDLFFGISGFLITSRLIFEYQASGRISLKHFYVRRAFRILPAAVVYLVFVSLLTVVGVFHVRTLDLLASTFFLANYINPGLPYFWYIGHFWSLSVEEHFYIVWPGLLRQVGMEFGFAISSGLALAVAAWRMFDSHFHWVSAHWLIGNAARTDYRADTLFWGCAAAFALQSSAIKAILVKLLPAFWSAVAVLLIAGLSVFQPRAYIPLIAVLVPTLVLDTLLHPNRTLGRLLEHRAFRWVGRLSYSLYLWQQLFLTNHKLLPRPSILQVFPLNIALAFLCAYLSFRLIERPCIALGSRLISNVSEGPIRVGKGECTLDIVTG